MGGGGGHPVCTIIIFVYVLRINIYNKLYQEPIRSTVDLGEIVVNSPWAISNK